MFEGFQCAACGFLNSYPMRTGQRLACLGVPVVVGLLGASWLAVLLGVVSSALLLLDLRLRLDLQKHDRRLPMAEASAPASTPSDLDVRAVENAQLLAEWTIASSSCAGFLASLFLGQLSIPWGRSTLFITIQVWSKSTLPKMSPEVSTLVVLGIYVYFVALAWLAVRQLAILLGVSASARRLYTLLLLLPGINLLALATLSRRAKAALRTAAQRTAAAKTDAKALT